MDVHLTPYHPFRDVDWRYQKSRNCLLKNGRPTQHLGKDPWKDQFRFLKRIFLHLPKRFSRCKCFVVNGFCVPRAASSYWIRSLPYRAGLGGSGGSRL